VSARCTGEAVSWLRLDRFHLGELAGAERAEIAAHLAGCAACAACLARIQRDEHDEALELAPLEVRPSRTGRPREAPSRVRRLFARASVLAAAAVVALAIGHAWRAPDGSATGGVETGEPGHSRSKGDGLAFVLVRDDGERLADEQGIFRDGDRFKAVVTCPPSMSSSFDLVVFDASGASFPLEPARRFACGNEVPLPGAFRLTGAESETICVVWREDGVDRASLSRSGEASDGRAMCKELRSTTAPQ
jgi:hypothetical protein